MVPVTTSLVIVASGTKVNFNSESSKPRKAVFAEPSKYCIPNPTSLFESTVKGPPSVAGCRVISGSTIPKTSVFMIVRVPPTIKFPVRVKSPKSTESVVPNPIEAGTVEESLFFHREVAVS